MLRALTGYAVLLPIFEHHRSLLVANNDVVPLLRARLIQVAFLLSTVPPLVLAAGGTGAGIAVSAAMIVGTTAVIVVARPYAQLRIRATLLIPLAASLLSAVAAGLMLRLEHGEIVRSASAIGVVLSVYLVSLLLMERDRLISNLRLMMSSLRRTPPAAAEEVVVGSDRS